MSEITTQTGEGDALRDQGALIPRVDVIEDAQGITLYADMPGVPKERLNLHIESDTLLIEGEFALSLPESLSASHVEIGQQRYRRAFTLSKELDASKITAACHQGVLELRIPKAEHAHPRRIQVQVA